MKTKEKKNKYPEIKRAALKDDSSEKDFDQRITFTFKFSLFLHLK